MKADYLEFKDKCIQMLTEIDFLNQVQMTKEEILSVLAGCRLEEAYDALLIRSEQVSCRRLMQYCEKELCSEIHMTGKELLQAVYEWCRHVMFPCNFTEEPTDAVKQKMLMLCRILRAFLKCEEQTGPFKRTRYFKLVTAEEESLGTRQETAEEYAIFLKCLENQYIMEFMRIAVEITPFDTLGHVAGVHYVAMHVARQLKMLGKPVDLMLMSAAAALHDIGKFGCRKEEAARVPYLHYYYTDRYTKRFHMPVIGHIAANHSTWDLELEDLSIENLILIYADFRVKSIRTASGAEQVCFYSLKDSFDVILSKLDNVDEKKKNRYRLVYARLKDFEEYMVHLGVNIDFCSEEPSCTQQEDYVLMTPQEIVDNMKYLAIDHNIYVMERLTGEMSLRNLLEAARGEKNWRNLRAYMNVLQEYFTYLTHEQTHLALRFLFEQLMHGEVDIRRQSAHLIGQMTANYDRAYRKELPKDVELPPDDISAIYLLQKTVETILYPDYQVTEQHRKWQGYSLRRIVHTLMASSQQADREIYRQVLLTFYQKTDYDAWNTFLLLDTAKALDYAEMDNKDIRTICDFTISCREWDSRARQMNSLQLYYKMAQDGVSYQCLSSYINQCFLLERETDCIQLVFLRDRLAQLLGLQRNGIFAVQRIADREEELLSKMFLDDLKVAAGATMKQINIAMMEQVIEQYPQEARTVRIATHLCSLMSASQRLTVREKAGELLVKILCNISSDQCNEMVIELTESLDSGDYQYAKFIPHYLGRMVLYLQPQELDELIEDTFYKRVNGTSEKAAVYTLHTIGTILENYGSYRGRDKAPEAYEQRKKVLLGYLMKGLVHFKESISIEALNIIGHELFGSEKLAPDEKCAYFSYIAKHLMSAVGEQSRDALSFYNRASALSYLYRFITAYEFTYGRFEIPQISKVAFFPGTFDPFSSGHKGIVEAVRKAGFEVYLAIDEFSWSKKTQPRLIRRRIAKMSTADIGSVYLFPDNCPVNIANPSDLKKLKTLFHGRPVYIVTGMDVIAHASAYQAPPVMDSIHHCNHIVFTRKTSKDKNALDENLLIAQNLYEDTIKLELGSELDDVSSSKIRENIDRGRDISNLIDPLCQRFIYEYGIYLREPQYKELQLTKAFVAEAEPLGEKLSENRYLFLGNAGVFAHRSGAEQMIVRRSMGNGEVLAAVGYHEVLSDRFYEEFQDEAAVHYLRKNAAGRLAVITGVAGLRDEKVYEWIQLAMTETIAACLKLGFTYIACRFENEEREMDMEMEKLLYRFGFLKMPSGVKNKDRYLVDMTYPLVLIQNVSTELKAPFDRNPRVRKVLLETGHALLDAMKELYPGNLVISFDAQHMNQQMMDLITFENHVPAQQGAKRVLGKKMCVPFGKILRDVVVPNTVTKAIYTEKVYTRDASASRIEEYPNYSPLPTQIETIKSFKRPVILADDILHKGDRIKKLYPMLKKSGVPVERLVVGILSGHGTDLSSMLKLPVESIYYIPNVKAWFQESTLYPFLGGDMIEQTQKSRTGLLPAINQILPYVIPQFLPELGWQQFNNLSLTCLLNTQKILRVLEAEYQKGFGRNLTLGRLGEAVKDPYCVDVGSHVTLDLNVPASEYIENDIIRLKHLKNLVD